MDLHLTSEQMLLRDSAAKFMARQGRKSRADFVNAIASFAPERLPKPESLAGLASCSKLRGWTRSRLTELALVLEQAGRGLVCEPIGLAAISAAALAQGQPRIRC